ncbi:MAG: Periplasmic binding protein [Methanosaeta sp. PtaB.Bin039]|nr:MAG: Periplasmic binding protein [Methanosaeta sp. PtaB.Bin039]
MSATRQALSLVLFLMTLIAAAAGSQTEYVLGVYGNANLDHTIDDLDLKLLEEIIAGQAQPTELSDANLDGTVDGEDLKQVKMVINDSEDQISIRDGNGQPLTIKKPVSRIVVEYLDNAEMMEILGADDLVVGVDLAVSKAPAEFPDLCKKENVGAMYREPDYEKILSLNPDMLLTFSNQTAEKQKNLPEVTVLFAGLYYPDLLDPWKSAFTDGVMKLGYVLDREESARGYVDWHAGTIEKLISRAASLPDEAKPTVLVAALPDTSEKAIFTYAKVDTLSQMVALAGGRSAARSLPEYPQSSYRFQVDPEWVMEQDPDYIILLTVPITYSGLVLEPQSGYGIDSPDGMKDALDQFCNRTEFSQLNAVKGGRVHIVSGSLRNDATKGLLGAAYLARILYPELDLDPEALHRQYLEDFLGLDLDLDEHGVFVYPPIILGQGRLAGIPDRHFASHLASQEAAAKTGGSAAMQS